ncbi:hypothetical protein RCL06_24745, partial [Salmonella enterica subsp. enterica serovar Typhimurium]
GAVQAPLGRPALGAGILLDAARAFVPLDREVACTTFAAALDSCMISWSLAEGTDGVAVARAALAFLDEREPTATSGTEELLL